jgi:hypothetical protein
MNTTKKFEVGDEVELAPEYGSTVCVLEVYYPKQRAWYAVAKQEGTSFIVREQQMFNHTKNC